MLSSKTLLAAAGFICAGLLAQNAAAETKTFAVSVFIPATYTQADNCPDGTNPSSDGIFRAALLSIGKTPAEVDQLIEQFIKGVANNVGNSQNTVARMITERAVVDGRNVNVYINPTAAPDTGYKTAVGRHALGFNLDARVDSPWGSFEDPETGEKGVDNQLFRMNGCLSNYQATPPAYPNYPLYTWEAIRDTMPAWIVTLEAPDLSKDGPVKITFDRSLNTLLHDAQGKVSWDSTLRTDSDPRAHTVIEGEIKNGFLWGGVPNLYLPGDPFFLPELDFTSARVRIKLKPDGSAEGVVGGYLPLMPLYFHQANSGLNAEMNRGIDIVGYYNALRRLADADPDPATGQNRRLSTAWLMEFVPVFVVPAQTARVP